jgi:DNA mismatch endonuclease (patch repair protein)
MPKTQSASVAESSRPAQTVFDMTSHVKRHDPLTPKQRSAQMAKVRGRRNRSTDMRVAAHLMRRGFRGWKRHPRNILGCPDFCFVQERVMVFVDGCFWHGCPKCRRNLPYAQRDFWRRKIDSNRRRDRKVTRLLRAQGYTVVRIWEHDLSNGRWVEKLWRTLQRFHQRSGHNLS